MRKIIIYTKSGRECVIKTSESRSEILKRLDKSFKKHDASIFSNSNELSVIVPIDSIDIINVTEVTE
jgi:hypothetical protein